MTDSQEFWGRGLCNYCIKGKETLHRKTFLLWFVSTNMVIVVIVKWFLEMIAVNQAPIKLLSKSWGESRGLVEGSVDNLLRESKILHGSKRISSKEIDEDQKETFGNLESSRKVVKNTKSDNFCLERYYSWIFRDIAISINKFKKYALSRNAKVPRCE